MGSKVITILKPRILMSFSILALLFGGFNSFGQERDLDTQMFLDSLWAVWQGENKLNSLPLDAIGDYTWKQYVLQKPDSAIYYGKIEHDFAQKVGSKINIVEVYKTHGTAYWVKGGYIKSLNFFERDLVID